MLVSGIELPKSMPPHNLIHRFATWRTLWRLLCSVNGLYSLGSHMRTDSGARLPCFLCVFHIIYVCCAFVVGPSQLCTNIVFDLFTGLVVRAYAKHWSVLSNHCVIADAHHLAIDLCVATIAHGASPSQMHLNGPTGSIVIRFPNLMQLVMPVILVCRLASLLYTASVVASSGFHPVNVGWYVSCHCFCFCR